MKHVLIGAALAAALLAAPAAASSDEKRRDVRINVADLDLGTAQGIAALDRRLAKAVVKACGTAYYLEPEELDTMERCRAAAQNRAMATRNALLGRSGEESAAAAGASK